MVNALDSGFSGLGFSPGQGTVLCSWARHFTCSASLYPGVEMDTSKFDVVGGIRWGGGGGDKTSTTITKQQFNSLPVSLSLSPSLSPMNHKTLTKTRTIKRV